MIRFDHGFGPLMSRYIDSREMSWAELSRRSTVDRTYLYRVARGECEPTYTAVLLIAAALQIPWGELAPKMPLGIDQLSH